MGLTVVFTMSFIMAADAIKEVGVTVSFSSLLSWYIYYVDVP